MALVHAGDTPVDPVRERTADRALDIHRIIATVGHIDVPLSLLGRFIGDVVHQAASGVAAEQRSLWTFQDFDAIDVEGRKNAGLTEADIPFVHVDGVGIFGEVREVVLGDAADAELPRLSVATARYKHAGGHIGNVGTFGHAHLGELLAGIGGNGDTDLLYVLLAFLRGDDDLFQYLRPGESGSDKHECSDDQRECVDTGTRWQMNHGYSPCILHSCPTAARRANPGMQIVMVRANNTC